MKKISSRYTFFHKKVFPVLWFGFLAVFAVIAITSGAFRTDPMFAVIPCLMALFGFVLMKKLVWNLVDEVCDGGDYLLCVTAGKRTASPFRTS
jgi:hypothetical protein